MKKLALFFITIIILSSCDLDVEEYYYSINLVSIGLDYKNTIYPSLSLDGTINDAREFEKALNEMCEVKDISINSYGLYQMGFDRTSDTIEDSTYPSKATVLYTLEEKIKTIADENSINIIFYSGHGTDGGSLVLAITNEDGTFSLDDEGSISSEQTLSVDEMYEAVENIPGKTVIIADSCYSGNFYQDSVYSLTEDDYSFAKAFELFFTDDSEESDYSDIYVISAAKSDEESAEYGYTRKHGYFTKALLEGMGWCDGKKGILTYYKIDALVDEDGIQGILADGNPPATSSGILSLDSLVSYVDENIDENATQTAQISAWRYDLVLFEY